MAFKKGQGGRPRGVRNKATAGARAAFQIAFEGLGGAKGLEKWGKENPTEFYKLFSRLIPIEHTGEEGGPVRIEVSWL